MSFYRTQNDNLDIVVSTIDMGCFKTKGSTMLPPQKSFKNLFDETKIPLHKIVRPNLKNSCDYKVVNQGDGGRGVLGDKTVINGIDGLLTKEVNLYLAITTADCFPIILHDKSNNYLALAHGGWRGVVGQLEIKLLEQMLKWGTDIKDVNVTYAAGICQHCYVQHNDYLYNVFIKDHNYPKDIVGKSGDFLYH